MLFFLYKLHPNICITSEHKTEHVFEHHFTNQQRETPVKWFKKWKTYGS